MASNEMEMSVIKKLAKKYQETLEILRKTEGELQKKTEELNNWNAAFEIFSLSGLGFLFYRWYANKKEEMRGLDLEVSKPRDADPDLC